MAERAGQHQPSGRVAPTKPMQAGVQRSRPRAGTVMTSTVIIAHVGDDGAHGRQTRCAAGQPEQPNRAATKLNADLKLHNWHRYYMST